MAFYYLGHSGAISADKLNAGGSLITGQWSAMSILIITVVARLLSLLTVLLPD